MCKCISGGSGGVVITDKHADVVFVHSLVRG